MKNLFLITISFFSISSSINSYAQETLQSVTDRGNATSNNLSINPIYQPGSRLKALGAGSGYFDVFNNSNSSISLSLKRSDGASVFEIDGHSMNTYVGGNVGIGTSTPQSKLHIYQAAADQSGLVIQGNTINDDGAQHYVAITLDGDYGNATGNNSQIRSYSNLYHYWGSRLAFFTTSSTTASTLLERMRIDSEGNVGIGTQVPKENLSVNGKIRALEIKVETANWPDYVFDNNYELPKLNDIESFVKKNKHLPGIPSAAEVRSEGIDLGEMNEKLLKKIEELTLHLIEQNKTIESYNRRFADQDQKLTQQAIDIQELKSRKN